MNVEIRSALVVGTDTLTPLTQPRRTLPHATGNYKEGSVAEAPLGKMVAYCLRPIEGLQVLEHLHSEKREGGRHQAPKQVVARQHGRRIIGVCVSLVIPEDQYQGQRMVVSQKQ